MDKKQGEIIVYFDIECLICDGFVQFLLKRDTKATMKFGDFRTFHEHHKSITMDKIPDSIVLEDEQGNIFFESDAVLLILKHLPRPWSFLYYLRIIPRFIRNAVYRFVASVRYKLFGKKDSCELPSPALRDRFIS